MPALFKKFLIISVAIAAFFLISASIPSWYSANLGVTDPTLDYIVGLIGASLLTVVILAIPFKNKDIVMLAWLAKLIVIFGIAYFYETQINVDEHIYYLGALKEYYSTFIPSQGTANITLLIGYINSLFPSFRLAVIVFAFIGFIGQYLFWYAFSLLSNIQSRTTLIAIMFFPSLIFWTHILGKEPIIFFAISLYMLGLSYLKERRTPSAIILLVISFILFAYIRVWLVGIFAVALIISLLLLRLHAFAKLIIAIVAGIGILISIRYIIIFTRDYHISTINDLVSTLSLLTRNLASGNTAQYFNIQSLWDYFSQLPSLSFSLFFRPLPWEAPPTLFGAFTAVENSIFFLVSCVALAILLYKKLYTSQFVQMMIVHILCWDLVYVFIGTRNFGAGSRFKIQILPFVLFLLYYIFVAGLRSQKKEPVNNSV